MKKARCILQSKAIFNIYQKNFKYLNVFIYKGTFGNKDFENKN